MGVLLAGKKIRVAGHTRETPEVLVLTPRAVAPTEHLEGDEVLLTWLHEWGDVELRCHLRILAIAGELAIHVEVDARRH